MSCLPHRKLLSSWCVFHCGLISGKSASSGNEALEGRRTQSKERVKLGKAYFTYGNECSFAAPPASYTDSSNNRCTGQCQRNNEQSQTCNHCNRKTGGP